MQFEVWARGRESKKYKHVDTFLNENEKFYKLDCVNREVYSEAMIVKTEWQQQPSVIMFVEFPKSKELKKAK